MSNWIRYININWKQKPQKKKQVIESTAQKKKKKKKIKKKKKQQQETGTSASISFFCYKFLSTMYFPF